MSLAEPLVYHLCAVWMRYSAVSDAEAKVDQTDQWVAATGIKQRRGSKDCSLPSGNTWMGRTGLEKKRTKLQSLPDSIPPLESGFPTSEILRFAGALEDAVFST